MKDLAVVTHASSPVVRARSMSDGDAHLRATWIDVAGRIYLAGIRARGALDAAVADSLRSAGALDAAGRTFVVDTAQGMFRCRKRLEAAAALLPFEPTRHALVCLYLAGAHALPARALPGDPRLVASFAEAWQRTSAASLDVRASLPVWLVDAIVRERGPMAGEALCLAMTERPPTSLRANTRKTDRASLIRALAAEDIEAHECPLAPDGVTLARRADVFRTRAYRDGAFEPQDSGSQLIALLCEARPGMTVVDGCAGAGGKTLHLSALMNGKGALFSLDVNQRRLDALKKRAARADAQNVRVHHASDARVRAHLAGKADVVLVDAPCSGSGALRRNPDTSWRLQPDDVTHLCGEQREILDGYAPLVARGGRLVYATCSVLARENQAQVESFLARHPEFSLVDAGSALARAGVTRDDKPDGETFERTFTIDPLHPVRPDGFFGAVLARA